MNEHSLKTKRTLLFAEDEEMIRTTTTIILEKAGYKVIQAENGEIAYQIALEHLDEIDILLTDIKMPKMDGNILIDKLLKKKPELKIIISSGYLDGKTKQLNIGEKELSYIIKPYLKQELLEILEGK